MPLDIFIAGEAIKAWHRTEPGAPHRWDGIGRISVGHRKHWEKESQALGILQYPTDDTTPEIHWEKRYKLNEDSLHSGEPIDILDGLACFTDGSKLDGKVGCGYVVYRDDNIITEDKIYLGKLTSVFQAEVHAIDMAARDIKMNHLGNDGVTVFSDSQAALRALSGHIIKSKVVLNCIESLNTLAADRKVTLRWVKAHVGHVGNERADMLAKEGSELVVDGVEPFLPVPTCEFKLLVRDGLDKRWTKQWRVLDGHRQTKLWFDGPCRPKAYVGLRLDRVSLGTMVQFITGHNFMARHSHLLKEWDDPTCRLCLEEEETAWHVVAECPATRCLREDIFQEHFLWPNPKWSVKQITTFLRRESIGELMTSSGVE